MVRVEGFQLLLSKWDGRVGGPVSPCFPPGSAGGKVVERSRCSLIVWRCTEILPPTSAFNIFLGISVYVSPVAALSERPVAVFWCWGGGPWGWGSLLQALFVGRIRFGLDGSRSLLHFLPPRSVVGDVGAEAADLMACSKQDAESHPGEAAASCLSVLRTMGRQNHGLVTLGCLLAGRCGRGSRWRYN